MVYAKMTDDEIINLILAGNEEAADRTVSPYPPDV